MAKWGDVATLIAVAEPGATNENGFYLPIAETRRDVFANRASVGYSEFYKSQQEGVAALLKLTIRTDEYNGERIAEHAGRRYKISRTYETKNGEFTELTLTDLAERDEPSPDGGGGAGTGG